MAMKMTRRSHQTPGPTNLELLNILQDRIEKDKRPSFITDMHNLYEKEPWLLQHVRHVSFDENVWFYYFVTRNKRPGMKKADSERPSRKVAEAGTWKTTGIVTQIKDEDGVMFGSKKHISFKAHSETEKDVITTGWTMHEFVLAKPVFQEVVLCRIRFHKRKDNAQYAPRLRPIVIGLELEDDDARQVLVTMNPAGPSLAHRHQYFSVNVSMKQRQDSGSYGQQSGEFLGQKENHILGKQETYVSLKEDHHQEPSQNLFWRHGMDPSHSAQAMEEKQQQHSMMELQDFGSSALGLAPNELPTVPKKIQQQHDNVISNSAAQLQLEEQDNVPLINQTMEAQAADLPVSQGIDESHGGIVGSPTYSELFQELIGDEEMDSEMTKIWNDFLNEEWVQKLGKNTPEEEAELMDILANCDTFESFMNSLLSK